ncbi:hypothetical protein GW932_02845 [archaeon]|nr:hypothetical protein [archaeon]
MNLLVSNEQLTELKLEIVSKAVVNGKFNELKNGMFFKTFTQLEASNKLSVGDRIWIGRMLKLANDGKPVKTIPGIAIFHEKNKSKKLIKKFK